MSVNDGGRPLMQAQGKIATLRFAGIFVLAAICLGKPESVSALPWDIDMYRQESLRPNEVVRAPVTGTFPVGRAPVMTTDEADQKLKNPVPQSTHSAWRGRRLWSANCTICHGPKGDAKGPVGPMLAVPNLLEPFYKERSDGRVYGVITNGGAIMPRYGFKFSEDEKWDIVNYLRFLQGGDVTGLQRPE